MQRFYRTALISIAFIYFEMRGSQKKVFYLFFCVLCIASNLIAQESSERAKYWVFFKDKPVSKQLSKAAIIQQVRNEISPRALKRRAKVKPPAQLIDEYDFPVSQDYLAILSSKGFKPIVVSRWLNAASFMLTSRDIQEIKKLPFVKKIQPVGVGRIKLTPLRNQFQKVDLFKDQQLKFDYGPSLIQNALINVPQVHELGITGLGIWIGMLDTGFRYRDHEAFKKLRVLAERDFINNDDVTEDQPDQDPPGQHNHGTETLSVIGAFKDGQLIGTAFNANFLLAKTEIVAEEIRQEEDFWVAGLEWMERKGVDVVSSSLGYLDFYQPSQMDGNTAVTTIAADIAVSKGVVVNSAGNERQTPWHIIISPADGDSVIAVGAVDEHNNLATFSSVGPTADGRIKPDVVAMGVNVYTVYPPSGKNPEINRYAMVSGTSFSCPQVAGLAALVLSAHPFLTPIQVRDALRLTADRATRPDTLYGWGLVNALDAILFHGTAFSNLPQVKVNNNTLEISIKILSKHGVNPEQVKLIYSLETGNFNQQVFMTPGLEPHQFTAAIPQSVVEGKTLHFYFMATDSSGAVALHPYNAPDSTFTVNEAGVLVEPEFGPVPERFELLQNYPNPFNNTTIITFRIPETARVSLEIYNLLGQRVRTLINNEPKKAGQEQIRWDGRDESGRALPSGVYFYRLRSQHFSSIKKMILVK